MLAGRNSIMQQIIIGTIAGLLKMKRQLSRALGLFAMQARDRGGDRAVQQAPLRRYQRSNNNRAYQVMAERQTPIGFLG
jgi:hypothetical protein